MKRYLTLLTLLAAFALMATAANAQGFGPGLGDGICNFIDEDGDGYNDLAPDADGDGIPNCVDPDYVPPMDGTGNRYGANRDIDTLGKVFGEGNLNGGGHYGLGDCINDKTVDPVKRRGHRR